jgi:dCTP deaminase
MILSDTKLQEALKSGEIQINPSPTRIEPASIDLSIGAEAFLASADEVTQLSQGKLLILSAGEMALIITREELKLSPKIVGHMGLRSFFTRKGLVLLAGPQIDPGFEGNLHVVLCNLSPTEISISFGEPFCTVEFHQLLADAAKPYNGSYQKQKGITPQEIQDIRQRRGYSLSEVIKNMQSMAKDIDSLKSTVEKFTGRTDLYMKIFVTTLAALAIGVLIKLFI